MATLRSVLAAKLCFPLISKNDYVIAEMVATFPTPHLWAICRFVLLVCGLLPMWYLAELRVTIAECVTFSKLLEYR